jgi:hypothetical protein
MSRKRVLDFVSYIAVALFIVALAVGLALSGLDETRSKGIIAGCLSAVVVFGSLMQQFWMHRRRFAFLLAMVIAAAAHLTLFFLFGGGLRAIWLILITPVEFAFLVELLRRLVAPKQNITDAGGA